MIVLGGWLFADLLLGLAMLFFTANTVGQPPPSPTPTATPNLLATAQAAAQMTQVALSSTIQDQRSEAARQATAQAIANAQATATANALATRAAMTDSQRATADAQATQAAMAAEATIAAFATQQAESQQNIDAVTRQQATMAAMATQAALAAQATNEALATQGAQVAAIATENANNGANALATANAQATQVAEIAAIATQNASSGANAQATINALNAQQAAAIKTATVLAQRAQANSIYPGFVVKSFSVEGSGVRDGDSGAMSDAKQQLHRALDQFSPPCRIGVVLTAGGGDVGPGNDLAKAINSLIKSSFPDLVDSNTAYLHQADTGASGDSVSLQMLFFQGCPQAMSQATVAP